MNIETILFMALAIALVFIAAFIMLKFVLEKQLTKTEVIEFAFDCILWAEENIVGTGVGQEKLSYVCGKLNSFLPKYLQPIITAKVLEDFVNEIFEIMKDEFKELQEGENGEVSI